jgi:hypothetical protein
MIVGLQRMYPEPPAMVFNLEDGFLRSPGNTFFGFTEITGALHLVWGDRPLLGFTGQHERPTFLQDLEAHMEESAFRSFNIGLWGEQATIRLIPTAPVATNYQLANAFYRCVITACEYRVLVAKLAEVSIQAGPIPNLAPR